MIGFQKLLDFVFLDFIDGRNVGPFNYIYIIVIYNMLDFDIQILRKPPCAAMRGDEQNFLY